MASPRPKNLSGENLDKYNQKLLESVLPFKQKAFDTYQANIRQASENSIENEWILKSKERLQSLMAELGIEPENLQIGQKTGSSQ